MYATCYRPTPYRPQHLGNIWNAFQNWLAAYRSGGEFVFVADDICAEHARLWISGYPLEVMVPQYVEELEWLGMKPDRVEWSSSNRDRHEWAREKLGYKRAERFLGMPWLPMNRRALAGICQGYDDRPQPPADGYEGWVEPSCLSMTPQYLAACVVDDHDFGITLWCAGDDMRGLEAWLVEKYALLGFSAPYFHWHPMLKGKGSAHKLSKSNASKQTIASLREVGYTPRQIMETLLECEIRSWEQGLQCVTIPDGILGLDTIGTLTYRQRLWEQNVQGLYHVTDTPEGALPSVAAVCAEWIAGLSEGGACDAWSGKTV